MIVSSSKCTSTAVCSILHHPTRHTPHATCGRDPSGSHNEANVCIHTLYRSQTTMALPTNADHYKGKGKGNVHPRTGHKGPEVE